MELPHPLGHRGAYHGPYHGLHERPVERKIDFGDTRGRFKPTLVGDVIPSERADIIERARFTPHHPISRREVWVGRICGLVLEYGLIETGW